ncbi:hypothetical protein N836_28040 [Leptolyngbya sp. Heron Island J]|uniref:hypothetical protein n=1 Tax=Leptolyngbya sp. Heron Island J TaxID=1385935 RepID=UPI0003B95DA5|nr:hypothetical protein [Leptolyngbya sp. Heron Island J]ESA32008.1 hypothetical protein N836_28040 [Leptolyngbya sp. Heron Island J]
MIRHLALASVLAIGSSVFLAPTAKAQDASTNVPFYGTVEEYCNFDYTYYGYLAPDANPATELSSTNPGGYPGYTYLTCNGAAQVEATTVSKTSGPALAPFESTAVLNDDDEVIVFDDPVDMELIEVDLTVSEGGDLLTPGDYEFEVTVTATVL